MTNAQLRKQYTERANAEREAGGSCEIHWGLGWVNVELSDGSAYYFDGSDTERLLSEVPEWICAEDYILAMAQNW